MDNLAKVNPKLTDIVGNDPDELKLLSNDEIGGLSSGDILLTTLGNDRQTIHSADVLDLASDTSFNSEQHESYNIVTVKMVKSCLLWHIQFPLLPGNELINMIPSTLIKICVFCLHS
jgi:hypothetical protein